MVRHVFALILGLALTMSLPPPAYAINKAGTCVTSVTLGFDSPVKLSTSAAVGATLDGTGDPCAPVLSLDIPDGLVTTADLGGAGTATVTKCAVIIAEGDYSLTFDTFFASSAGRFTFVGSPAGGSLTLVDLASPDFVGEVALVADPLHLGNTAEVTQCASSTAGVGMDDLHFVGALVMAAS